MPLRILHVDSGREWRGGQRQVLLLTRGQRDQGHEPLVVAAADAPLLHRLRSAGLAASALRMRADWDLVAARRLHALVATWRPHIVHAHDARAHALALGALIGKRDIPLVVTRRVAFTPRGRLKYGPRVARFIAISHAVRDALVRGGVPVDHIDVVYSGVPTPRIEAPRDWRVERGWAPDTILCGVVGAMTAEKGVRLLAGIGDQLAPALRSRIRLVLLGGKATGTESLGGIEAYRAGFVDEVHRAMAGLDLLWHPSSAEGLGTAVIDAMALGVPPIAFSVGGLPELIVDGTTGLLVPPGDVGAFAQAASRALQDTALRRAMHVAGPERARQFSVERMVAGTGESYVRVLSGTGH
ncbi:MAG: glycosyltransferase family 4 protein [Gemmatimonadaceae bacterium]|nr:glycosyltransferase family 4 protein [Gemmatimonadaceae bacterium]